MTDDVDNTVDGDDSGGTFYLQNASEFIKLFYPSTLVHLKGLQKKKIGRCSHYAENI
jgi:hypothetical protein